MKLKKVVLDFFVGDQKFWRLVTNLLTIVAIFGLLYSLYLNFDQLLTSSIVEIILAFFTFFIALGATTYIYTRLRTTFLSRKYPTDYTILSHRQRVLYAIRLSFSDSNYFIALIWLKATRAFLMVSVALVLLLSNQLSKHTHSNSLRIGDLEIYPHSVMDFTVILTIAALCITTALNAYETHAIASGVCRLRINRYLARRKSKV